MIQIVDEQVGPANKMIEIKRNLPECSIYRIAGKFGGEFNLAVWRLAQVPLNLIPAKFNICQNFVKFLLRLWVR